MPQVGDLTQVDAGFSTSLGRFSSKWSANGTVFHLEINTFKGTTGTVGVPLPGNFTSAILTGMGRKGDRAQADGSGRFWIDGVDGGDRDRHPTSTVCCCQRPDPFQVGITSTTEVLGSTNPCYLTPSEHVPELSPSSCELLGRFR